MQVAEGITSFGCAAVVFAAGIHGTWIVVPKTAATARWPNGKSFRPGRGICVLIATFLLVMIAGAGILAYFWSIDSEPQARAGSYWTCFGIALVPVLILGSTAVRRAYHMPDGSSMPVVTSVIATLVVLVEMLVVGTVYAVVFTLRGY